MGLTLTMIIRQIDFLIRNERARNLSYERGFCVRNTSEHNFIHKLITLPRTSHSFNNSLHQFLFAGFRKLRYLSDPTLSVYYSFDEEGETVVDGSLSGNDGTVVGSIELQSIKIIYI